MEQLRKALDKEGIAYTQQMIETFTDYRRLTLEWNEKVNLTAIKDPDEFEVKHFVDSVSGAAFYRDSGFHKLLDVGTGAGFPGVPLAILFPDKQFTLLDSLAKRVKIIEQMTAQLGLANVRAIHGRAEDLARMAAHRQAYDVCLSRAVAKLAVLCELCLPFVRTGGYFCAYKSAGPSAEAELDESERAVHTLGAKVHSAARFVFPASKEAEEIRHQIIFFEKVRDTPANYPRKAGMPEKKPL